MSYNLSRFFCARTTKTASGEYTLASMKGNLKAAFLSGFSGFEISRNHVPRDFDTILSYQVWTPSY